MDPPPDRTPVQHGQRPISAKYTAYDPRRHDVDSSSPISEDVMTPFDMLRNHSSFLKKGLSPPFSFVTGSIGKGTDAFSGPLEMYESAIPLPPTSQGAQDTKTSQGSTASDFSPSDVFKSPTKDKGKQKFTSLRSRESFTYAPQGTMDMVLDRTNGSFSSSSSLFSSEGASQDMFQTPVSSQNSSTPSGSSNVTDSEKKQTNFHVAVAAARASSGNVLHLGPEGLSSASLPVNLAALAASAAHKNTDDAFGSRPISIRGETPSEKNNSNKTKTTPDVSVIAPRESIDKEHKGTTSTAIKVEDKIQLDGKGFIIGLEKHNYSMPPLPPTPQVSYNSEEFYAGKERHQRTPMDPDFERYMEKPHWTYAALISQALLHTPGNALPIAALYRWIRDYYPHYDALSFLGQKGWENSVRHNLSLNNAFIKEQRTGSTGKGSLWRIDPEYLKYFRNGSYHRPDKEGNVTEKKVTEQRRRGTESKGEKRPEGGSGGMEEGGSEEEERRNSKRWAASDTSSPGKRPGKRPVTRSAKLAEDVTSVPPEELEHQASQVFRQIAPAPGPVLSASSTVSPSAFTAGSYLQAQCPPSQQPVLVGASVSPSDDSSGSRPAFTLAQYSPKKTQAMVNEFFSKDGNLDQFLSRCTGPQWVGEGDGGRIEEEGEVGGASGENDAPDFLCTPGRERERQRKSSGLNLSPYRPIEYHANVEAHTEYGSLALTEFEMSGSLPSNVFASMSPYKRRTFESPRRSASALSTFNTPKLERQMAALRGEPFDSPSFYGPPVSFSPDKADVLASSPLKQSVTALERSPVARGSLTPRHRRSGSDVFGYAPHRTPPTLSSPKLVTRSPTSSVRERSRAPLMDVMSPTRGKGKRRLCDIDDDELPSGFITPDFGGTPKAMEEEEEAVVKKRK